MSNKKVKPTDNSSNQRNANKGTKGTNVQYDKTQGNKGQQLNKNTPKK
jgi:hypothetical protein